MSVHRLLWAAGCAGFAFACHAEASWVLPKGSVMSVIAGDATVHGAPTEMLSYEAPLAASALIAFFSRQYPALRDMAVFPGMAVLSDAGGPCMRMATVSSQGGRSRGTLSTICWKKAMAKPAPPAWLPSGATLAFEFAEPQSQAGYVQQIWQYEASSPDDIDAQLRGNLARQGWRPAHGAAGGEPAWQSWRRGTETVVVDVLGQDAGCILAVLRFSSALPASGGMP